MNRIDALIYRIWNSKERSEVYDVLNEVADMIIGKTEYEISPGNISLILNNAFAVIKQNYGNTYTLPEARLILFNFNRHLNLQQFSAMCLFILRVKKRDASDIINMVNFIEFYPEIRDDHENIVLIELLGQIQNLNPEQLARIVPFLRNRQVQLSYWRVINYASLKEGRENLRQMEIWYYISPEIVYDIYRYHFNGNKRCPKEIKLQILGLISILEVSETEEMPCSEWVRSLCNSLLEDLLEVPEILSINRFTSMFQLSSAEFENKINKALFKSAKTYEDLLVLNASGYFVYIENSLKDLAQKYKKSISWFLETKDFLGLISEHDEDFIFGLRESTHGILYINYRKEREAANFFEKNKKDLGL